MTSKCSALVSDSDGWTKLLTGSRLALSLHRLFQLSTNVMSSEFLSQVDKKIASFDLILTDQEGAKFFKFLGLPEQKYITVTQKIILESELESVRMKIEYFHSTQSSKKDHFQILNAMSLYSDRMTILDLKLSILKFYIEDFAEMNDIELTKIPKEAWIPIQKNIYPVRIPRINLESSLDFLVIDCPARNLSLLPNGVAYLETSLRKNKVNYQVLDLDVITYHLFHMHRLFDIGGQIKIDGVILPDDPWLAHNYDVWSSISEHQNRDEGVSTLPIHIFFEEIIEKTAKAIAFAEPRILGFSIQQCSEVMSANLIQKMRENGLNSPVIVGGFSCYNFDIGLRGFPLADYMCIGEAETTISNLINEIKFKGEAKDLAGVIGRFDSADRVFSAAPMIHNLDTIDFPTYSWTDLKEYINWDGYQLIPIIASRGCRWSRCTFCAERFYWRIRSASDFVDELEWHVTKGHYLFMFNESDLNGMPERVLEICDEIINRGLHKKVKLTGQLRIHRKSDAAFFAKLRAAGFVALRFGVDSFSRNGMKLQQKGYTPEIVAQNLRDCSSAGIFVEVNWVIGVPGEQESDIDEGIKFILENKNFIGRLANLNPLILVNGSVYWLNPEDYDIHFKEGWEDLKKKFPRAIPAGLWWSENPFIDSSVRQAWFQKVVKSLFDAGFPIGDWAKQVIDDVESKKDAMRSDNSLKIESSNTNLSGDKKRKSTSFEFTLEEKDSLATIPSPRSYNFVQSISGYAIYSLDNIYYAVHESITTRNVDLDSIAIYKSKNITELKELIDDALNWANSRGAYGSASDSGIKVDSNLSRLIVDKEITSSLDVIVRVDSNLFLGLDESETIQSRFKDNILKLVLKIDILKLVSKIARLIKFETRILNISSILRKLFVNLNLLKNNKDLTIRLYSHGARPELIASWDDQSTNIVRFDGLYYAVPHGLGAINLDHLETSISIMKELKSNKNLKDLMNSLQLNPTSTFKVEKDFQKSLSTEVSFTKPKLIKSIDNYNVVGYEGFYYAIPQNLGDINLEKIDAVEDERIFRDVSIYAVEDFVFQVTSSQ